MPLLLHLFSSWFDGPSIITNIIFYIIWTRKRNKYL